MDNKDLEELLKEVADIPPISGDMVKDYVGLLNKEMAAIQKVWTEYNKPENKAISEKNPFITNHMLTICNMYERLLKFSEAAKDPDTLDAILQQMNEVGQQGEVNNTQPETEG